MTSPTYTAAVGAVIPFSTSIPLAGNTIVSMPLQAVVAASGQPAATFTVAPGAGAGGQCILGLVANGVSNAPNFGSFLNVGPSWINTAGVVNWITLGADDDLTLWYSIAGPVVLINNVPTGLLPTPTAFVAALNGSTITITYSAGLAAVTPSIQAFALNIVRPNAAAGAYTPPVPVLSSVSTVTAGTTSVVLNVMGGTFLSGDTVTLSYWLPSITLPVGANGKIALLQDQTTPLSLKLPAFSGAVCTVQ